jgi:CRISPR-associated protein Csb2
VPLPYVIGPHPDGTIMGLALALPRDLEPTERQSVLQAIGALERLGEPRTAVFPPPPIELRLGEAGVLTLRRLEAYDTTRLMSLEQRTWCGPARHWASVTPVALDRNPGDLHSSDAARRARAFAEATDTVRAALEAIGVPADDARIDVLRSAVVPGSEKPNRFPRFPAATGKPQRVLVHVRMEFPEPVLGPLIVGAGRYRGLGLCKPVADDRVSRRNME